MSKLRKVCAFLCIVFGVIFCFRNLDSLPQSWIHNSQSQPWNTEDIASSLRKWLVGVKSGKLKNGGIQVRMFDPDTEVYEAVPEYALAMEYEDDDQDRFRGGVTIGSFVGDKPHELTWQWKGGELYHGLLYGQVDSAGMYTGDNITFIYPDLQTGLQGRFVKGELVEAHAVEIVAERELYGSSFTDYGPP